ncbi:MAG: hypothetical protein MJZ34_05550 [Paludibacteraceae bacterium]|nr:hypothetical protein [Paludibacteraceae bacterium]
MKAIKVEYIDRFNYKKYIGKDVVVNGNVNLSSLGLTELPNINFISVKGTFDCSYNKLKNLKNSPRKVGNFWAFKNKLESLEGATDIVEYDFTCSNNNLKTLEGSPKTIKGSFNCTNNQLTSLIGAPEFIGQDLIVLGNNLTSLDGCTPHIGGDIFCNSWSLESFDCQLKYLGGQMIWSLNVLTKDISLKMDLFNERYRKIKLFKDMNQNTKD